MGSRLDLNQLSEDILVILREYGLAPDGFVVSITVPSKDFDAIAAGHSDHIHPEMIRKTGESNKTQWSVQILRRRALEDFPPGAILSPPPDD
jgi:hypothetical protein